MQLDWVLYPINHLHGVKLTSETLDGDPSLGHGFGTLFASPADSQHKALMLNIDHRTIALVALSSLAFK